MPDIVHPRPAASVLLVRDIEARLEVLVVERPARGYFGGLYVFPGGAVDPVDHSELARTRGQRSDPGPRVSGGRVAGGGRGGGVGSHHGWGVARRPIFAGRICSKRSTETGPVWTASVWFSSHAGRRPPLRRFASTPGSMWLRSRRAHRSGSTLMSSSGHMWADPEEVLAMNERGDLTSDPPHTHPSSVAHQAKRRERCPGVGQGRGWAHSHRAQRDGGRFVGPDPSAGGPMIRIDRVLANNPGPFTGPGTNTWLLDDGHGTVVIIDPGPIDARHAKAIESRGRRPRRLSRSS